LVLVPENGEADAVALTKVPFIAGSLMTKGIALSQ
jgi:hypothetical protein